MNERKEDAVSPVVGVMLMLVVTIIIAAVVSGFAGGLAGGTEAAPQAAIDVGFQWSPPNVGMGIPASWAMNFKLLSGDSIPTKDLEIITYYTFKNGTILKGETTTTDSPLDLYGYGGTYVYRVPALNNLAKGWGYDPAMWFGNVTWVTGDQLSTLTSMGTAHVLGMGDTLSDDFGSGSVVDVKILHVPSGKYIYDKEVIVP